MTELNDWQQQNTPNNTEAKNDIVEPYIHNYSQPHQLNSTKTVKPIMSFVTQLALLLGLIGVALILASIVSLVILRIMTGSPLLEMQKALENPANATAVQVVQVVSTALVFLLPAIIFSVIVHGSVIKHLQFKSFASYQQIMLVFLLALAGVFVSGALAEVNNVIPIPKNWEAYFRQLEDAYNKQVLVMAKMSNWKDLLIALFVIALTPAIFEEVLFRGVIQQFFAGWFKNGWLAILVTSILFSAIHMSYFGFLPRMGLGIILGLLFYFSRNIWTSILLHFVNNGFAVAQLYVLNMQGKLTKDALEDKFPIWIGIAAIVSLVGLLYLFKKDAEKNNFIPNNA